MRIKKLIIKLGVILLLFGSVACKNKNTELEKKIANLEKQNPKLFVSLKAAFENIHNDTFFAAGSQNLTDEE